MADDTRQDAETKEDFGKDESAKVNRWMVCDGGERAALTAERLREIIHYNPDSGEITWRARRSGVQVGCRAGCVWRRPDGRMSYLTINVDGTPYRAHVLAWLYMTGAWPVSEIDHRDTDGLNNRWNNLRAATRTQNNANHRVQSNNSTGFKGVTLCKATGRYKAQIQLFGRNKHLGRFDSAEQAHAAYCAAAESHFGEFARVA